MATAQERGEDRHHVGFERGRRAGHVAGVVELRAPGRRRVVFGAARGEGKNQGEASNRENVEISHGRPRQGLSFGAQASTTFSNLICDFSCGDPTARAGDGDRPLNASSPGANGCSRRRPIGARIHVAPGCFRFPRKKGGVTRCGRQIRKLTIIHHVSAHYELVQICESPGDRARARSVGSTRAPPVLLAVFVGSHYQAGAEVTCHVYLEISCALRAASSCHCHRGLRWWVE